MSAGGAKAGGITQHIGAYQVRLSTGRADHLPRPRPAMLPSLQMARAAGAGEGDGLSWSSWSPADDGVMPQNRRGPSPMPKAAGVPIIVAINKNR